MALGKNAGLFTENVIRAEAGGDEYVQCQCNGVVNCCSGAFASTQRSLPDHPLSLEQEHHPEQATVTLIE